MSEKKMIYIHGYYHVEQVAEIMGVNQETVRRWIRSGKLHAMNLRAKKCGYKVYGRTNAYKCGLADGKRYIVEQMCALLEKEGKDEKTESE